MDRCLFGSWEDCPSAGQEVGPPRGARVRPSQGPVVFPGLEPLEPAMQSVGDITNRAVSTRGLLGETGGSEGRGRAPGSWELLCVS